MPSILRQNVAADTPNAVEGLKFEQIPASGALLTLYASTPVTGGNVDVSVDSEDFVKGAEVNIEASADVVDTDRDLVLDQEPVPGGKLFIAVNDQIVNFLAVLEYL